MSVFDFIKRVNGVSVDTPWGGVGIQWDNQITDQDINIARNVVTFLEDRRVLYTEGQYENLQYCSESIFRIREYLTEALCQLSPAIRDNEMTDLEISLREMRSACQMALTTLQALNPYVDFKRYYDDRDEKKKRGMEPDYEFVMTLVTLRTIFAININKISRKYNVPVREKRLQQLIDSYMVADRSQLEEKDNTIYDLKEKRAALSKEIASREFVIRRQTDEINRLREQVRMLEEKPTIHSFFRRNTSLKQDRNDENQNTDSE